MIYHVRTVVAPGEPTANSESEMVIRKSNGDQENNMPNIAGVLKEEISRLARKEVRKETDALRKAAAQYRRDIAQMKRRIADLQRKVGPLEKKILKEVPAPAADIDAERVRFSAKGLRSQRQRMGLSAAEYGKLIGVTDQTIYNWEHGTARPRRQQLPLIASMRQLGKREAQARLEQLTNGG
jgi:DNA-binding transcriptional regulator YiaG